MKGIICMWSGDIVDIPAGWALCNGNNGTPNLTDRFVMGAGNTYLPDDTGGSVSHDHTFTPIPHAHDLAVGVQVQDFAPAGDFTPATVAVGATGTVGSKTTLPPWYALAFIIKL